MKSIIYLFAVLLFATFSSCSNKVEDSFTEVETNLTMDIPIVSVKSHDYTSVKDHAFIGSYENNISDIVYKTILISNISNLTSRPGAYIMLSGIMETYEIDSLSLQWNYQSSIDPSNVVEKSIDLLALDYTITGGVFQANIDNELGDLISKIDDKNGTVKIEITGLCNYNLSCFANLMLPVTIETKVTSPRFEIF